MIKYNQRRKEQWDILMQHCHIGVQKGYDPRLWKYFTVGLHLTIILVVD